MNAQAFRGRRGRIRYAVVGLGHIAQAAVLPAFEHAAENSEVSALVSDDPEKLRVLGERYGIEHLYSYDEFEQCLTGGEVDAVYLALPNNLHASYTIRAAEQGIHVLCEKPMAVTEQECQDMLRTCELNRVKLMIAYRLHFEEANLSAVKIAQSGQLGELRIFDSTFAMQVREQNIRLERELGGGTLFDLGIYCINAARYIFQAEPLEVYARSVSGNDSRFREVDEMTSAVLMFPGERLATFTCSFGATDVSRYQIVGTKGRLEVDPAYDYAVELKHRLTIGEKTTEQTFAKRDQFAPELIYFSNCIVKDKSPEPSGQEGFNDVRIINALYKSAQTGHRVELDDLSRDHRPTMDQEIHRSPVRKQRLVHTSPPTRS